MRAFHPGIWALVGSLLITGFSSAASSAEPAGEQLRYVIDQRDGSPVPGAIVVATWRGSFGPHGAPACNRVESYVSGTDGSFRTPNDPQSGTVLMGVYKKGYELGRPPRVVRRALDGNLDHWQVVRMKRNATNTRGEFEFVEPTIYPDEGTALRASRERIDAYVQKNEKDRDGRLRELHRMQVDASCGGITLSTPGAVPFYKALYDEQVELGDSQNELDGTLRYLGRAAPRK